MKKTAVIVVVIFLTLCGYGVADALDRVPGLVTLKEPENLPQPYPQIDHNSANTQNSVTPNHAPIPDAAAVQKILDDLAADSRIHGSVGALVVDAVTGKEVGAVNSDTPLTPASTMKIVTAVSALEELGPEFRFTTHAALSGSDLYLIGGGDILLSDDAGNPDSVIGHAGLGDLARAAAQKLNEKGVGSVNVYLDTSLYSGPAYAPDLSEENYSWVMENSPIAIDRALNEGSHQADPAGQAMQVFAEHLRAAGIDAQIQGESEAAAEAEELASVDSAPLRKIVDEMLLVSDNSLAENLAHYVGAVKGNSGDFAGGAQAVSSILAERIDGWADMSSSLVLSDGSGLSPSSKLTAQALVNVLGAVWNCDGECAATHMGVAMPYAGYDGTLSKRFVDSSAVGRVRAKTGSLDSASSLAGYAYTAQGRPLIFAIIVNSASGEGAYGFRSAIDDAVTAIVAL